MKNLNIGITPGAIGRRPQLRADRIRRDGLTMLAAALAEDDDNSLRNALEELIDAAKHRAPDVEVDALVADIEDLAGMGRAVMDLTPADVEQLADEAVHAVAIAAGSVVPLPTQQDRRRSA
jgi:hypothetical protein